jgi:hypothetical protein
MKNISVRRPKGLRILSLAGLTAASVVFIAACDPSVKSTPVNTTPANQQSVNQVPVGQSSPAASPGVNASPVADVKPSAKVEAMAGKWNGPEGTYLNISKKGTGFEVEIRNLEGSKKFVGVAKGDTIEFTRNGKPETIKPASGVETGMKGFEKETNCLVVTKGSEGFCKKQ